MATQSKISALQSLSSDVLSATSAPAIAELVMRDLPLLLGASSVRLYLFNAGTRSLASVAGSNLLDPIATSVDRPTEGIIAAAVRCFRQDSVVNIPRLRRDEAVNPDGKKGFPSSALFAPVSLNTKPNEPLGVIQALRTARFGSFDADAIAALKMIAAQTAAALQLHQYREAQDRLARSEQLAANAQLIANAAADLRPRTQRLLNLFCELPEAHQMHPILCDAREEALHAAEAVTRLLSFGASKTANLDADSVNPPDSPLDVNTLLAELVHFRAPHWNALGLRVQNHVPPEAAMVQGQRGQLEHGFLDMAIHAERAAVGSNAKLLAISTTQLGGQVVVQFLFPSPVTSASVNHDDASLKLCQEIAQHHKGEFQLRSHTSTEGFDLALEMDLPLSTPPNTNRRDKNLTHSVSCNTAFNAPDRPLTLMLVDADLAARKQLLGLLAQRGHRVIPVAPEETPSLAQRMRFDGILWAVRSGGPKWSDYQQRLRELIPAFVLVSTGYDAAFASSLAEGGGYLLARPVEKEELDRVLNKMLGRMTDKLTANCAVQV